MTEDHHRDPGERGAVTRVLRILACFHHDCTSATAKEIAAHTGIPDSSVFRLVARLNQAGLLWHDAATGRYGPGLRLVELGDVALSQMQMPDDIEAVLRELQETTDEDASLSVWRGGATRTCIAVFPSKHPLREFMTIGQTHDLWVDASGKAIAAFLPPAAQRAVVAAAVEDGMDATKLVKELERIGRAGRAVTEGARVPGVMAISSPVRSGEILIGSVTVSGPAFRISPRLPKLTAAVHHAAMRLGGEFGRWRGITR